MQYRTDVIDDLIVCLDNPLNDYDQKLFINLFQPILSMNAVILYNTLCGLVPYGSLESEKINHKQILKNLKFNDIESFTDARSELEALGLVETYVKPEENNLFILVMKRIPTAYQFFNDAVLSTLLLNEIGEDAFNELAALYLIHRYDINTFENTTKAVDEVFSVVDAKKAEASLWWVDTSYTGTKFKNEHFNYELFNILVGAQNILTDEERTSKELYENINRLAWIFSLDTEKMIDALRLSIIDDKVDYSLLRVNCKKVIDHLEQKFVVKRQTKTTESTNELVNALNKITPSKLVYHKTKTSLTTSEIMMFDEILVKTNVEPGVLNTLISYVLDTKDGDIPAKNYYMKILNSWLRKGINTTEAAVSYITGGMSSSKTKQANPQWYEEYLKNLNTKPQEAKSSDDNEATMAELEKFFNEQNK